MMLQIGDKIGIVGCSNAYQLSYTGKIDTLLATITKLGLIPVSSNCIYEKYSVFSGTAKERADELHRFYTDHEIKAIFDISGGDVANEILEYIDFTIIKENPKPFFGYSDLTTIMNAIYAMTGEASYLYQIRNLIYNQKEQQIDWFSNTLLQGKNNLFDIQYTFLQGEKMDGIVVGGNLRCLLKLAGTPYLPDFTDKILLLEAYGGDSAVITTLLAQLKHMGVFTKIRGVLLGTFTKMEENQEQPTVLEILINLVRDSNLPIAKTKDTVLFRERC